MLYKRLMNLISEACVAQRDCIICRISGDTDHSALALSSFTADNCQSELNPRMNAELGKHALQSEINHIQREELAKAIEELGTWHPLGETFCSKAEQLVLFHMDV